MSAQLHNIAEFERRAAATSRRATAVGRTARIYEFTVPGRATTPKEKPLSWPRGIRFALKVEFAGGLFLLTVWWLWHIAH